MTRNYLRRNSRLAMVAVALSGLSVALSLLWSCSQPSCSGHVESIRLGTSLLEPSIPLFIAEDRQYFAANGLNVDIKYYDSGLNQVDAMLKGDIDISGTVAEYVLVGKAFKGEKIRTIGCIDKAENAFIVIRKDRGIESVADLKGKKVGVARGTILEFYLGRYLNLHGMNIDEVMVINTGTFSQSAAAVVAGDVDACISFSPFVEEAQAKLGDRGDAWPAQSSQPLYTLLITTNQWLEKQPDLVRHVLSAVSQGEDYIVQHPEDAGAIALKKLNVTSDYTSKIWSRNRFSLTLDQSLITAMEDEARWMIADNVTTEKTVPNFQDYIYVDGLQAIKPGAVDIIR